MSALEHVQAAPAPRERPILFSGPLVRAILAGTKTQTRRPVAPRNWSVAGCDAVLNPNLLPELGRSPQFLRGGNSLGCVPSPFGAPGDRLWVRETLHIANAGEAVYRADYPANALARGMENIPPEDAVRWTPSIHMPRWASRIALEVTGVRVERLQAITEEDARAEGIDVAARAWPPGEDPHRLPCTNCHQRRSEHVGSAHACPGGYGTAFNPNTYRGGFAQLWDQVYGAGAWSANGWVWCIEFRRLR